MFYRWIGVPGMFALTGVLALLAILVVKFVTPNPGKTAFHSDAETNPARLKDVLRQRELLRLNWGIFALHAAQMAMLSSSFTLVDARLDAAAPLAGLSAGTARFTGDSGAGNHLWRKTRRPETGLCGGIALMLAAQMASRSRCTRSGAWWRHLRLLRRLQHPGSQPAVAGLENLRQKPRARAMGVYNTSQALGLFFGGAAQLAGAKSRIWRGIRFLRRIDRHLAGSGSTHDTAAARRNPDVPHRPYLCRRCAAPRSSASVFTGVEAVTVLPEESCSLKVAQTGWAKGIRHLLRGESNGISK